MGTELVTRLEVVAWHFRPTDCPSVTRFPH